MTRWAGQNNVPTQSAMNTFAARHRPYPSYKHSGVEWLGDVPAHWEVARLKSHVANITDHADACGVDEIYLALENVESWTGKLHEIGNEISFDSKVKQFQVGDILFGKLRPYLAKVYGPSRRGVCVGEFLVLRGRRDSLLSKYLQYLLLSKPTIEAIDSATFGAKMPRADWLFVGSMNQPLPPLFEQHAIAAFLDRETAKIDVLVSKKERLIELLQEKRTALISHTVTKGLYSDAPLKDSGVEWLGKIPEHWEVKRLKHLGELQGGAGFPHGEQWNTTQEHPFFKVGDMGVEVNHREMIAYQHTVSSDTARRLGAHIFQPSTIIFAKVGAALMLNRRRMLVRPSCIDNNMMGFIPRVPDPDWMLYWLSGLDLSKLANPGAVPSVNEGQIREQETILPPLVEQRAIADFLDRETAKLDNLVDKVQRAIELLMELRSTLISAAVTGKIDVRGEVRCT